MSAWLTSFISMSFILRGAGAQSLTGAAEVQTLLPADRSMQNLSCEVEAIQPFLSLGRRMQTGYLFRMPASAVGSSLTVVTAVTPMSERLATYLVDRMKLPESAASRPYYRAGGSWFVGAGQYRVNWRAFDDRGRTCSKQWEFDATSPPGARLAMPPNHVSDVLLSDTPLAVRSGVPGGTRVTVLLDAAPLSGTMPVQAEKTIPVGRGGRAITFPPFDPGASVSASLTTRD
jgi:hypothetical protein